MEARFKNVGIGTRIMVICQLDQKLYQKPPFLGVFGVFFSYKKKKKNVIEKQKIPFSTLIMGRVCAKNQVCAMTGLGWASVDTHTDRQIYQ